MEMVESPPSAPVAPPLAAFGNLEEDKGGPASGLGTSVSLRAQAKKAARQVETGYMDLAKILYRVYCELSDEEIPRPLWQVWGFESFDDYADRELALQERKARFLVNIWRVLEVNLIALDPKVRNRIVALGWSKAKVLARVVTLQNAEQWAERGEKESVRLLEMSVRTYQAALEKAQKEALEKGGNPEEIAVPLPPDEELFRKEIWLTETQKDLFEAALKKAGSISGSTSPNTNLALVVTDFMATTSLGGVSKDAPLKYIARFEALTGLRFVVVDPETNDVLMGIDVLEALAKGGD